MRSDACSQPSGMLFAVAGHMGAPVVPETEIDPEEGG
jgi:hypothetical protein